MSTPPEDRRAGLQPPQFRLATLLWAVAVMAVFSAFVSYFGLHAALILFLFGLAIAAHVAGNALGTQLRENGDRPLSQNSGEPASKSQRRPPTADDFAPSTELRDRRSLGLPIAIATTAGGMIAALFGLLLMVTLLEQAPTWSAIVAGTIACGALGAIWTFVFFGFIQVAWGAIWQATRTTDRQSKTPNPS